MDKFADRRAVLDRQEPQANYRGHAPPVSAGYQAVHGPLL
jgi:hypothetical protein